MSRRPTADRLHPTQYTVTNMINYRLINAHILTTRSSNRSSQGLITSLPSLVEFSAMTLSRSICMKTLSEGPPVSE